MRFKLEANGKEAEWQYATNDTISYEALPNGIYRLVMQASNSGNDFNNPEKTLVITISPPFWETWWFRIIAAMVFIGILYMDLSSTVHEV